MADISGLKGDGARSFQKNIIWHGDCIDVMKGFPDHSVDIIFADPPYNLQLSKVLKRPDDSKVEGVNDQWDRFANFSEYDTFTRNWIEQSQRVLKKDGTIWVIGSYHNIYRVGSILQDHGFWILNDIIWHKTNPMPNFRGTRFTNAHETMLWCTKEKSASYKFNYEAMKNLNEGLQMRSDWFLPICRGKERVTIDGQKAHSTQKPEALLYRVLLASTVPGDTVLDPFFGSGTTGVVAKRLGRNYIGIEREENYIKIAKERIKATEFGQDQSVFEVQNKKKNKRLPFGYLIENGYLKPGEKLYNSDKTKQAILCSDSLLKLENFKGSIHQTAAHIQGKSSSNGWTYWFFENDGSLEIIDSLRKKALDSQAA